MAATIDPERAVAHLRRADPVMARVIEAVGPPRLRQPEASPFQALARSILFQQLSGRAASAILERFVALFAEESTDAFPEPERVLAADESFLRSAGVSRAKAAAIHDLAARFASGDLSPDRFDEWDDEEIIAHLTRVRGVGRWTAQMFLMFQLRHPDVLPVADAGLNRAMSRLYGLPMPLAPADIERTGAPLRPWATVACWYLWRSEDVVLPVGADAPPP